LANWEFQGFYNSPSRTATPASSGYSSESVSRTSSFSSSAAAAATTRPRQTRLASADDSVYSDVYSTIDEELTDPFDDDDEDREKKKKKKLKLKKGKSTTALAPKGEEKNHHEKTKSMSSLLVPMPATRATSMSNVVAAAGSSSNMGSTQTIVPDHKKTRSSCSLLTMTATDFLAPPLPPRASRCRPPARPPYPSSLVRAVLEITDPLNR
jgi:hypothetical protein